jgi:membrane protease YdiL (CAAX protease family)
MTPNAPEPTSSPEPADQSADPRASWAQRFWPQLSVGLLDRVPREQRDTDADFRRRRIVAGTTLLVGAVCLALTLRMDQGSPWFTLATLGVAVVWFVGAFASGKLHAGRISVEGQLRRPFWPPLILGAVLALVFVVGAFVTRQIPFLADQATNVLGFAEQNSLALLAFTTLVNGVAEEFFFRGALYAAIREPHQVWVTTVAYVVATLLTGNVMLAFAAVVIGYVTGLQRRSTGGLVAPIITHLTWSMTMLFVLPLIF